MSAGPKRHRVSLQRWIVTGHDPYGAEIGEFQEFARPHAEIVPLVGREFFTAQQTAAQVDHRIRIRWASPWADLKAKDQIVFGERVFDITAVMNVNTRSAEFEVMAKEQV